jgi:ankyrin repeat protein
MAATIPNTSIDHRSLSKDDPSYQEKLDLALFQVVSAGQEGSVAEIVSLGANPTSIQRKGRLATTHALLLAVQNELADGSSSGVIESLCKASKVRQVEILASRAPLSMRFSFLTQLLNEQIDVNAADNQGNTALHVAAQRSQLITVERLLSIGANALSKNLQENTPIHQSVSRPSSSSESERERARKTVETLIAKVEDTLVQNGLPCNKQGDSILIKAVHQGNLEGAQVIVEFVKRMVKEGRIGLERALELLNKRNQKGFGPVHEASIWAKIELLNYLVSDCKIGESMVFDVNSTDALGNTALHLAGDRRQTGIPTNTTDHVSFLLDHNIPVNAKNQAGETCIHIPHISREFLDLVLSRGGDVTIENANGETALIAQLRGGRAHNVESILAHIIEKKIDMNQFKEKIIASRDQFGNTMAHLLAQIDSEISSISPPELFQVTNKDGEKPIQVAIEEKSLHVLTTLVEFASEAEKEEIRRSRDSQGNSLLHQAVQMDYVAGVTALLDHVKFDINVPNTEMDQFSDGGLPIHLAAFSGSLKSLDLLLSRGASIDSQDNPTKDTPLHLAVRFNRFECAQALINAGASQALQNMEGLTAPDEVKSLRGIDENIRKLFSEEE